MANADHLLLGIGVGALLITITIGAVLQQTPRPGVPIESDCPELEPVPRIAPERSVVVMATSYSDPERWEFGEPSLVKWCHETGEWWVGVRLWKSSYLCGREGGEVACSLWLGNGTHAYGPWRAPHGTVPAPLLTYTSNAQRDLVFWAVSAHFLGGLLLVDDGYVDARTSELVSKERVGE